jgi:hypothetical protein|mmetsp:Transcript_4755/g.8706  ORF Transcript_4755/g.8706 Transcript_4755/m.8706 type:complete len:232 (+) Transcript_4755:3246-3941(+)
MHKILCTDHRAALSLSLAPASPAPTAPPPPNSSSGCFPTPDAMGPGPCLTPEDHCNRPAHARLIIIIFQLIWARLSCDRWQVLPDTVGERSLVPAVSRRELCWTVLLRIARPAKASPLHSKGDCPPAPWMGLRQTPRQPQGHSPHIPLARGSVRPCWPSMRVCPNTFPQFPLSHSGVLLLHKFSAFEYVPAGGSREMVWAKRRRSFPSSPLHAPIGTPDQATYPPPSPRGI